MPLHTRLLVGEVHFVSSHDAGILGGCNRQARHEALSRDSIVLSLLSLPDDVRLDEHCRRRHLAYLSSNGIATCALRGEGRK